MMVQLNPPIPLDTPKGPGLATFVIDYGIEHHLYWVVFIDETRECWTFSNTEIRAQKNLTLGRGKFKEKRPIANPTPMHLHPNAR